MRHFELWLEERARDNMLTVKKQLEYQNAMYKQRQLHYDELDRLRKEALERNPNGPQHGAGYMNKVLVCRVDVVSSTARTCKNAARLVR